MLKRDRDLAGRTPLGGPCHLWPAFLEPPHWFSRRKTLGLSVLPGISRPRHQSASSVEHEGRGREAFRSSGRGRDQPLGMRGELGAVRGSPPARRSSRPPTSLASSSLAPLIGAREAQKRCLQKFGIRGSSSPNSGWICDFRDKYMGCSGALKAKSLTPKGNSVGYPGGSLGLWPSPTDTCHLGYLRLASICSFELSSNLARGW
jgi:hypothetical protein